MKTIDFTTFERAKSIQRARGMAAMAGLAGAVIIGLGACGDEGAADARDGVADSDDARDTFVADTDTTIAPDTVVPDAITPDTQTSDSDADDELEVDTFVPPPELAVARGDRCNTLEGFDKPSLPFSDSGDTKTATDDYVFTIGAACGGPLGQGILGDAAPDLVYAFTPEVTATYRIEVVPSAGFDAAVMVTDACPPRGESGFDDLECLGVADDGIEGKTEAVNVELEAGVTYFVLVDSFANDVAASYSSGTFEVLIERGEDCDDEVDNNDDGKVDCADRQCGSVPRCDESTAANGCTNGIDDEGDGLTDCADDNCAGLAACNESTYLNGCANGVDDEGDGLTDCEDTNCADFAGCGLGATCATAVPVTVGTWSQTFDTCTTTSGYQGTAAGGCKTMGSAGDVLVKFVAPADGRYKIVHDTGASGSFGAGSYDSVLNVVQSVGCPASPLTSCLAGADGGDPETLTLEAVRGQTYWIIADAYSSGCGTSTLSITQILPEACADSVDNDQDGKVDCADTDCFGVAPCPEAQPGDVCRTAYQATASPFTQAVNTCERTNTFNATSGGGCKSMGSAGDIVTHFVAPSAGEYRVTFDTGAAGAEGAGAFDAILNVVKSDTCPSAPFESCIAASDSGDPEKVTLTAAAGESFWIIADGWSSGCGAGVLSIAKLEPEICDDQVDNDGDGRLDCIDPDCFGVGTCPPGIDGDVCSSAFVMSGATWTRSFDSCLLTNTFQSSAVGGCKTMGSAGDAMAKLVVPTTGRYRIVADTGAAGAGGTGSFDTILNVVKADTCPTVAPSGCTTASDAGDPETVTIDATEGETYWVLVDGYFSACGQVTLTMTKLEPEACGDGVDNDGDGRIDCVDTDCFGVGTCPNGLPGDVCATAIEVAQTAWSFSMDTCLYTSDWSGASNGGCKTMGSGGDLVVKLVAPEAGNYRVVYDTGAAGVGGTGSFDAILNVVKSDTCPASPLGACVTASDGGDPETVTIAAQAGETFWIFADGYGSGCGGGTLTLLKLTP
ncbi:MAG: hypothetical protein JNJ59_14145 [Deltaproteobacteria bacterium]|nr:hypothetical protein [Deltaproteobacteria bacterium]